MKVPIVERLREAAHAISQYAPEDAATGLLQCEAAAAITELVDALEAVKEFADEGETQLCWETANSTLAKFRRGAA